MVNPLQLTRTMRTRLLGAVRALVTVPALASASDAARLASVVLTAKATIRDGYRTVIWAEELGRWLGVSQSQVAHTVLPELRRAGVLGSKVVTNAAGHTTGLECWVVPMYRAQQAGDRRHALALSRVELAVLLRLCEVLFGPGWAPKDREPVPAGLLAGRRGRGAATDRLGLLLMVLSTGSAGWLQLCPGAVDMSRGRPAATVARLLGCSPAGGAKVLSRLQKQGVAEVVRRETASGLSGKSRVRLVPVAEAHGRVARETLEATKSVLSDHAATASGDLEVVKDTGTVVNAGISADTKDETTGSTDLATTARHHAFHAPVVTPIPSPAARHGFSGHGRGEIGDLPGRAGAREGRASDQARRLKLVGGQSDQLRGEEQTDLADHRQPIDPEQAWATSTAESGQDATAQLLASMGGHPGSRLLRRVPRPRRELQVPLAPAEALWDRMERGGARRLVEKVARRELRRVADWLGEDRAEAYLAARLTRRLTAQAGRASGVHDPVGWLLKRGLPRRSDCTDARCDEGILMHSGDDCTLCEDQVLDLRSRRRRVATEAQAELPHSTPQERFEAFESRLRQAVAADAAHAEERRRKRAAAEAASLAQAAEVRAQQEADEARRRALPCVQCGEADAAGLCGVCRADEETEALIAKAVAFVASGCHESNDPSLTAALVSTAEERARRRIQGACARVQAAGGTDLSIAVQGRLTAESLVHEYRATALLALSSSPEADAEARSAYAAQTRSRHLHPSIEAAEQAAKEAAHRARQRVAEHLLTQRSTAWLASAPTAATAGERHAVYEAGAAQARAAAVTHVVQDRPASRTTDVGPASKLLRPEPDDLQAVGEAEETARLRTQIAAEAPGLAAWTVAHHGATYTMPACSGAGASARRSVPDPGQSVHSGAAKLLCRKRAYEYSPSPR
ncbi:hypothetical protein [Streptomyces sp. NPDC059008]|uniref:hypothetical protein n=1 Tax=Streptomyces sp. NPDC059008 TaxID=3346693 RepID=UPI0036C23A7E